MESAPNRPLTKHEKDELDYSEDRRLREEGIDPDGDPIAIMMEVIRQYRELHPEEVDEEDDDA